MSEWRDKIVDAIARQDLPELGKLALAMDSEIDKKVRRPARAPTPAVTPPPVNWVGRAGSIWRQKSGAISYPRIGKALKEIVDQQGEDVVLVALERYLDECVTNRRYAGTPEWFAANWRRYVAPKYTGPVVQGGWLSDEFERATRP